MHDARDEQETGHEYRDHEVVHRRVRLERQQAEQGAARHALQAVFTTRERCLQAGEIHHLRQRHGDHGEVDALAPDGDQPDHCADQAGTDDPDQDGQLRCEMLGADEPAGDVGCGAEKGRMAEGQQAGKAQQQVERAGKDREAQQLHDKHRIQAEHRRQQRQQQQRDVGHANEFGRTGHVRLGGEE